jgi:hypothetical protein
VQPTRDSVAGIPNTLPPQNLQRSDEFGRVGFCARAGGRELRLRFRHAGAKRAFITRCEDRGQSRDGQSQDGAGSGALYGDGIKRVAQSYPVLGQADSLSDRI